MLEKELDENPTPSAIIEMAELSVRHLLCFRELEAFNNTGKFLYKHPLILKNTERSRLIELLKRDPKLFLDEYGNVRNNVSRYQSFLNKKKVNPSERDKWQKQLDKHAEKLDLMSQILNEVNGRI